MGQNGFHIHTNSAKSFVGRTVNLHMKDGSVIVNVKVRWVRKTLRGRELAYRGVDGVVVVPLSEIAHATPVGEFGLC
jgi:hypothetical protein